MNLDDHIMLWNHTFIKLMDVRHMVMDHKGGLYSYRLPASAFIYVAKGRGILRLDGSECQVERHYIAHGGKGLYLEIWPDEHLEYFIVMYKATLPVPRRKDLLKLMERHDPFQMQYGFIPHTPSLLYDRMGMMYQSWRQPDMLDKLQVKAIFYQFVYELMRQMHEQTISVTKPDPVEQAIRYMHERYKDPVTLESLAEMLDCSTRQLLRMFKNRVSASPIDYLIQFRMDKAKERLLHTDLTLKEIADSVGYADSYYFSRIFKKYTGFAPKDFKLWAHHMGVGRNNPSVLSIYPIVSRKLRRYIDDYENRYQYIGKGDVTMYGKTATSMAAVLFICLTLLLSACSGSSASIHTPTKEAAAANSKEMTAASPTGLSAGIDAPRLVKHAMGEQTIIGTPKRIVVLTNEGTEALLAVGVKPIGAVQSWIGDPWYNHIKAEMNDVTVLGNELQPNMELIATLKPDLIIGNKVRQEKMYEQLKRIAPTVFSEDLGEDWKTNFKLYMEAINKKEEGDKALAAFEQRVADVKAKLGSKTSARISVVRFSASQVRIYQKLTFSGALLSQLGFARPAAQDKDGNIEVVTKERIPDMDGDVMFCFVTETPGKTDASDVVQQWMNDPLFKELNVYKTQKIKQVDEAIWNSAGGYKAANLLLDELSAYFEVK
ncbi:AraC family transcriptional regulator [Paenibacillus thalictri]|uniref:Helix-turn-helix domain-containing protein n=1 Tax=Paenibacillus thalictri TaxID=2527873 RepID=A0A4Q9DPK4_9BACL|nr:AraC family transcriptional regulator [Paenibacillus thalictri]TBL76238.1 helix-turn-helix domain-containing protein [Paenibacillus thalictri]